MKYLITVSPGSIPIPPKMGADLLKASKAWIESKLADGTLDFVYNFFGGGGVSVGNADSHERILADMLTYPLYAFFDWDVEPLLEWKSSFDMFTGFYEKMASMMD